MSRRRGGCESRNPWELGEQHAADFAAVVWIIHSPLVFKAIPVNISPVLCQGSCFLQQYVNVAERWWMLKNSRRVPIFPYLFFLPFISLSYQQTYTRVMKVLEAWHGFRRVWNSVKVGRFLSGIYPAIENNRGTYPHWCNMHYVPYIFHQETVIKSCRHVERHARHLCSTQLKDTSWGDHNHSALYSSVFSSAGSFI